MTRFVAIAALLALSACASQSDPAPDNFQLETPLNETMPTLRPPVDMLPQPTNMAVERPAPIDLPSDEQMQEDAEASGMTSRLPGEDETAPVVGNAAE